MMKQIEVAFLCGKQKRNCKFTKKKPSPSDISYPILSPINIKSLYHIKRSFLSAPFKCSGSMTVEAVIVLPIFIFFVLNLLFYIEIFRLHSVFAIALHETGNTMAVYGHIYDNAVDQKEEVLPQFAENIGFTYLYVKQDIIRQVGNEYLEQSPLTMGSDGMNFLYSTIMNEQDMIDIVLTYRVSPLIDIAGFSSFYMMNRYYARAFTGYKLTSNTPVQYVYLAENGRVYHTSLDCTHLNLSIQQTNSHLVLTLRNQKGQKYTVCSLCIRHMAEDKLYITNQGSHYHSDINCSGLKRTVSSIPISEATQYPVCSRCQQ